MDEDDSFDHGDARGVAEILGQPLRPSYGRRAVAPACPEVALPAAPEPADGLALREHADGLEALGDEVAAPEPQLADLPRVRLEDREEPVVELAGVERGAPRDLDGAGGRVHLAADGDLRRALELDEALAARDLDEDAPAHGLDVRVLAGARRRRHELRADRLRGIHGHDAGTGAAAGAAPAAERPAGVGRRREGDCRAAEEVRGTGRPAVDSGGAAEDAAVPRLGDR